MTVPPDTFQVNDTITPSADTSPATNPPITRPVVIVYGTDLVLHAVDVPPVPVALVAVAPPAQLPATGASPHDIVAGALLIGIGVGCLLAQRIRRRT